MASDGGIEARAAGDEKAHAMAKHVVDASEEDFTEIEAKFAGEGVNGEERAEDSLNERAFLQHLFVDALEDEIEKLRHAGKKGDVAFLQAFEEVSSVE